MNPLVNLIFKLLAPAVLLWLTFVSLIESSGQVQAVPPPASFRQFAE